jgi:16S rRNA (adenine1518-N6/adenine1519-N6)-dimethyltransferase
VALLEGPYLALRAKAEAHLPDRATAVLEDAFGQIDRHAWHHNQVKRPQRVLPKKSLGQHFLVDQQAVRDVVEALDVHDGDQVLEIGPGQGVLTQALVHAGARVVAVELDAELIPGLRQLPIEVVQADILKVDPGHVFESGAYKVAGNIPYYISSLILRHLLEAQPKPELVVLMLQKELAERVVAEPGEMSLLSVSVQLYGRPQIVREVPARAFRPRPKVDSAVLRIEVYPGPAVPLPDPNQFFAVARAGFSERRKQVHNALQRNYKPGGAHTKATLETAAVSDALTSAGVDPMRRAETLSLPEWAKVADAIGKLSG